MTKEIISKNNKFLLYKSPDGEVKLDVYIYNENIWLTKKRIAELFGVEIPTINEHLKNIYDSAELNKNQTIRKFLIVQKEGTRDVKRNVDFYNLDAIISVGYRVNSSKATQFRIWGTKVLKEYIIEI
ncbi:virulence RhuM family protein [archaeon]|nr:virulence RhuM family protein [archaeon]NCP79271.1 virulence RhuM family protein [archaeon]NCP98270.1 virulence RhuM family protein [archaeon]NCQ07038.1 virulence RhuM family protein [archaeon]NCQ50834.1 virulence RhuM family protein [archaeon]